MVIKVVCRFHNSRSQIICFGYITMVSKVWNRMTSFTTVAIDSSPIILCMETIDFLWGFESNWNLEFFDSNFFLLKKTKTNGYETKSITHLTLDGDLIVHHLGFDSASLLCWVLSYPEFGCKNESHCYWITLQKFPRVCISHRISTCDIHTITSGYVIFIQFYRMYVIYRVLLKCLLCNN
jgi:hypothetical protein